MAGDWRSQLCEAHRLEHRRPRQAVDASPAPCLELVDVVEEGGGLDEAHVDRNPSGFEPLGRVLRNPRHALRVRDDPRREPARDQDAMGLLGVRNGHPKMLPAGVAGV